MWEDRYANSDGYFFGTEPARFLLDNPGWLRPGLSGLCVADGEGRNSVHMAQLGLNMTAFDLSETAVARARKLAADRDVDVNFTQSLWDDRDWNTPTYDLVAAIFIQFAGPSERGKQFAHIKAVVKPGGILMLHGYTREQLALGTGGPRSSTTCTRPKSCRNISATGTSNAWLPTSATYRRAAATPANPP